MTHRYPEQTAQNDQEALHEIVRALEHEVRTLKAASPSYFKDKILPSLLVALVLSAVSLYGTHLVYGTRLTSVEQRTDRIEVQMGGLREETQKIAVDVSFIRGSLTNPPKP